MIKRLKKIYKDSALDSKIRVSYLVMIVPFFMFLVLSFLILHNMNTRYEDMINSTSVASEFSLDFKKDFDYETYLLIVGNKTIEESTLNEMISSARSVVESLKGYTETADNQKRLASVDRYLDNLEIYVNRIDDNLNQGNMYEKNMEIWENDIQIVTSLLRETIFQYTYYEIKILQEARTSYQTLYVRMVTTSIITLTIVLAAVIFLSYYIPLSITRPFRKLKEVTDEVAAGNLSVRSDVHDGVEVRAFSASLNTMIDKVNELIEQITGEQKRLRKAEFDLLTAQINPHFLYNTLDAIIWLAESGEQKKVVSMVGSLSEFFRKTLNQGRDVVTVREELSHTRSYLEIQQVRYQDILTYEIDVPEELAEYKLPKITLQPLVENALYHGIKNKRGGGKITVSGYTDEGFIYLTVSDNGRGMTEEELSAVKEAINNNNRETGTSYGLYNVNERIRLNFGEDCGLSFESVYGEGTTATIRLKK